MKEDFEFELGTLRVCMMAEVHVVLAPFVAFTYSYNANKAHNMLTLMLGLFFKSLDVESVAPLLCSSVGGEAQHLEKLGVGILRDSRMFRARQQGEKHLALRCSWCRWKGLET